MVFACGLSRALLWKSSNHLSLPNRKYAAGPPNTGLQRTALGADKIRAILKPGFGLTAFPIYDCAAAEAQAVGRASSIFCIFNQHCSVLASQAIALQQRLGDWCIMRAESFMEEQAMHAYRVETHVQHDGQLTLHNLP